MTAPATAPKKKLSVLIEREQRRQRRRRRVLASLAPALAALGFFGWLWLRPKPVPVSARFRAEAVDRGDIVREVRATGRLEALTTVEVGAEISGRIASVEVDHNDRVRAGQVLARFDRAALEAQLAEIAAAHAAARALLEQAKTDRDRAAREERRTAALFAAQGVSEAERDIAHATARLAQQRVSAAEAELMARHAAHQLATTNLAHTVIYAPIDGIVITRAVDPGQTVAAMLQAPVLFTVAADLRKMHVIAAVDEADIGEVAEGQQAEFAVNAYPSRRFAGTVTKVRNSPEIVQDVVTYGAEIEVENADLALKPGMTASVRIRTASVHDALRVPAIALGFTPPGEPQHASPAVWRIADGVLQRVPIVTGVSDGELVEVAAGALAPGARVVVELTPEGRTAYGLGQ